MMFHGVLQATLILALLTLVSASLYPIQPIQNTVYYAGQTVLTRWIDDGTYPLLSNMGGITIQLYYDSDTYLATLATNVSPGAKAWQLDIPRSLVHDYSNFTLRYITNTPYDMIIYSADFTIVVQGDSLPTSSASSSTSSTTGGNLFFQASSSPSPSAPGSGSRTPTPSPTNIVMPPLRPGDVGNINQPAGNSNSRSGAAGSGRIDIEKLKFRVVFILWPAFLIFILSLFRFCVFM